MFDAVNIEYAFAYFLEKDIGKRGGIHDADVFRGGEYKDLGELLEAWPNISKLVSPASSSLLRSPKEAELRLA